MTQIELREKILLLYNSPLIRISDFEVKGEHTLTVFWVDNGKSGNIHGSISLGDKEEHRERFYSEVLEIWKRSQGTV